MPVFIGGDAPGDLFQYWLIGGVTDGGIIGRGAAFDHAAGDHLAPAGTTHGIRFAILEMGRLIALAEAGKGLIQFEGGIGGLGPAAQRLAMLAFFRAPALDPSQGLWRRIAE